MTLFRWQDSEGDEFEVQSVDAQRLVVGCSGRDGETAGSYLPRSEVLSLIQALTEWAYPTHTPEGPNRSLIEELIAKAVKDQVSAVLPLHLSPVVTCRGGYGCDALGEHPAHGSGCGRPDPEPGDVGHRPHGPAGFACTCHDSEGNSVLPDPEPGDVGHPRPAACTLSQPIFKADDSECSECGGRWADHPGVQAARAEWLRTAGTIGCRAPRPDEHPFTAVHSECEQLWSRHPRPPAAEPACTCVHWVGWHGTRGCTTDGCECRSTGGVTEPSDVGHPRPPVESVPEECTHCNHRWGNHNAQGCQLSTCTCTKSQVAEDGPCGESMGAGQRLSEPHDACGFIWALHKADPPQAYSTSRAPLPIREKTVIVPECGLCEQPWSDGHGQPGDPCPGVEAARQHPGDWTDALWRVQPSAPASEARYCDECGHSWESYLPIAGECVATKGKAICGCTRGPE